MGRFPFFSHSFLPPYGFLGSFFLILSYSIFPCPFFFTFLPLVSSLPFELEPGQKLFFPFPSTILFYSILFLCFFAGNSGEEAHSGTWRNWREGMGWGWENGKGGLFTKKKTNKKKQFKPRNFKSQKSRSKDLKNYYALRKPTGDIQQAAIVQCSAVQSEYRAYVLCESSAIQKECKPRIPVQIFIFIFYFSLACFPSLFLSLLTSRTPVCDLLLCSICTCTLCFCFGGGRVKLGTGGMHGPMGAWHNSSRGKREGKSRRAVFSVFFHSHIFSISQVKFTFVYGRIFLFFFFFAHFSLFEFSF